jgi:phosphoglycolate phosphatase-like HAD superfamily hydrolase
LKIKAVGFDFDGTLYDSFTNGFRALKDLYKKLNRKFGKEDEKIARDLWGTSLLKIVEALFADKSPVSQKRILKMLITLISEREKKYPSRLFPGTNQTLKELKDMGLGVFIATNHTASRLFREILKCRLDIFSIDYILAHRGVEKFKEIELIRRNFPAIDVTPFKKPDIRYVERINRYLKLQNILPHEIIFCGDSLFDAKTARIGGYNFVPVLTGAAGRTTGWWEIHLSSLKIPALAIASSVKDIPKIIKALES